MARKRLPQALIETVTFSPDSVFVSISMAAQMLNMQEDTLRNWAIDEVYPEYSPTVFRLFDVVSAYSKNRMHKIESQAAKIDELQEKKIDWNQRLKKSQTKTADLKNAQLENRLTALGPMKQMLHEVVQRWLSTIDDVPARLSPKILGLKDRQDAYSLLNSEMRFLRNALEDVTLEGYQGETIGVEDEEEEDNVKGFIYDKASDTYVRKRITKKGIDG